MRVYWKDEKLGDYDDDTGLSFDEMHQVKKQLGKQYQHPTLFIQAAHVLVDRVEIRRDAGGEPILDAAGNPTIVVVPNADWDPDAMRMFVVLMGRRVGKDWYFEDRQFADGRLSDLKVLPEPGETNDDEDEDGGGGKASSATIDASPRSRKKTSTRSSIGVSPASGSTSV